jgi:pilus assembly protein Flp/PilA
VIILLERFARDESGATAIEYTLIATLISAAIIVGAIALGDRLGATFNSFAPMINGPG